MGYKSWNYAERDNLDLPEVPRPKGDARHSVRLGISSGLAYRHHQSEEPELPLKQEAAAAFLNCLCQLRHLAAQVIGESSAVRA
jgi:hypothetical protein